QDVAEVVVGDDGAVDRHHERLLAELRHVAQDAPEVGRLHLAVRDVTLRGLPRYNLEPRWGPKGNCSCDQATVVWRRSWPPVWRPSRNRRRDNKPRPGTPLPKPRSSRIPSRPTGARSSAARSSSNCSASRATARAAPATG